MPSYQELHEHIERAAESYAARVNATAALLRAAEQAGLSAPASLIMSCWSVRWVVRDSRSRPREYPHCVEVFPERENDYTIYTGTFGRQHNLTLDQVIGLLRDGIRDTPGQTKEG